MNIDLFVKNLLFVAPFLFFGGILLLAVYYFAKRKAVSISLLRVYKFLIISAIIFYFFNSFVLTINQYFIWSQSDIGKILLNLSLDNKANFSEYKFFGGGLSYFLLYSYGRFWLRSLISIGAAFIFYLFLKFLKKYKERFFEEGEVELGFLTALIIGWPNILLFILFTFLFVVIFSIFKYIYYDEPCTALGWPFIFSALFAFLFGAEILKLFGIFVLNI